MDKPVRVRFAPSPTGPLHIGGVRTALYNYLFAKKMGGTFILRIEDTDRTRFVEGAEEYIIKTLKWCNILPEEGQSFGGEYGPYRQSDRKELYQKYVQQLIDDGKAYYAFDTPDELNEMREVALTKGQVIKYDYSVRGEMKNSLSMSADDVKKALDNNEPYVVRLKVMPDETIFFDDIIRAHALRTFQKPGQVSDGREPGPAFPALPFPHDELLSPPQMSVFSFLVSILEISL